MAHALANDISHISIHALLAESDAAAEYGVPIIDGFLSTLSLRRATLQLFRKVQIPERDFYPRSPCGERLGRRWQIKQDRRFLSTLSLRRATQALPASLLRVR